MRNVNTTALLTYDEDTLYALAAAVNADTDLPPGFELEDREDDDSVGRPDYWWSMALIHDTVRELWLFVTDDDEDTDVSAHLTRPPALEEYREALEHRQDIDRQDAEWLAEVAADRAVEERAFGRG